MAIFSDPLIKGGCNGELAQMVERPLSMREDSPRVIKFANVPSSNNLKLTFSWAWHNHAGLVNNKRGQSACLVKGKSWLQVPLVPKYQGMAHLPLWHGDKPPVFRVMTFGFEVIEWASASASWS